MGINRYLINTKDKEYMHFGKMDVVANTFHELVDGSLSINEIKTWITMREHWTDDTDDKFINLIADKFVEIAEKARENLMLLSDDIYEDLHGKHGVIDEWDMVGDWWGKTGVRESKFKVLFDRMRDT